MATTTSLIDDHTPLILTTESQENYASIPAVKNKHDAADAYEAEATSFSSILNIVNNIIGAGLLTLPWAFRKSSEFVGCFVLLIVCILSMYSFILLARCCSLTGCYSYKDLAAQALGQRASVIVQVVVSLYVIGSCISYVVLIGDFIPKAVQYFDVPHILTKRYFDVLIVAALILLPLSLLRQLNALRFTSGVAIVCIMYACGLIWGKYVVEDHEPVSLLSFEPGVFIALPLMNVSFTAHYNGPAYYLELKDRSLSRFRNIVIVALTLCFVLYALTATFGYITFGPETKGDVLNNYGDSNTPALWARLALAFVIIFTYPLAFNCLRRSISVLLDHRLHHANGLPITYCCIPVETLIVIGLVILTVTVGILVPKVEVVLAYKGAALGSCIVYVFPSLMYWKLARLEQAHVSWWDRLPVVVMCVFGIITGILGVVMTSLHPSRD